MSKKINKKKRLKIISTVILGVALLVAAGIYGYSLLSGQYIKPLGWKTYENKEALLSFDYPTSWKWRQSTSDSLTSLTASSGEGDIAIIKLRAYDQDSYLELAVAVDPDCRRKQARSVRLEDACSYIENNSMRNGYSYKRVGEDSWSGEYTITPIKDGQATKEQIVFVSVGPLSQSLSSDDLTNLVKSMRPASQ